MAKTEDSDETPFSDDEQEGEGGFPCDEPGCDYVGTSLHQLWGHKGKMHPKTEEKKAAKAAPKAPPKKGQVKRSPSPNPYPEPGSMTDEIDKAMAVQGGYKQQVKPIVNEMNVLRNFLEMSGLGAYTEPVVTLFEVSPADDYEALEEAMTVNGIGKPRRDLIVKLWKTHMGEEEDEDTPEEEETGEKKSGGKKLGVIPYKDPRTVDAAMFMNMTPGQKAQFQRDLQSLIEAEKLLNQVNQQVFQQAMTPYGGMPMMPMSPYGYPMMQQQAPVQMVPVVGPNGQMVYMPMQQPFPMGQPQQPQRDPETQALIEWMKKSKEEEEERKRMEPLYQQMRRFNEALEDMKGQKPQHTDPMAAMKELMALKAMANMAGDSEGAKKYDLQIQQMNAQADAERRASQAQLTQMQGQQNQLMIQAMQTQMNAQVEMARKEAELAKAGRPKDVMDTLNEAQRIKEMMENFSGGSNNQAGAEADAKAREREALWNNLGKIAETVAPIIGQSLAAGQMAQAPAAMPPQAPSSIQAQCSKCGKMVSLPNRSGTYPCPTPGCGASFDVTMPGQNQPSAPQMAAPGMASPLDSMPTAPPPMVGSPEMDERSFLMNQDMDMLFSHAARLGVDINPHMPPGKAELVASILAAKAQKGK